jgi:outer membrane biosynthesis protein TonB
MNAELKTSSGVKVIDQIALAMAWEMEFFPALNDRLPVPVWVSLPISIRSVCYS